MKGPTGTEARSEYVGLSMLRVGRSVDAVKDVLSHVLCCRRSYVSFHLIGSARVEFGYYVYKQPSLPRVRLRRDSCGDQYTLPLRPASKRLPGLPGLLTRSHDVSADCQWQHLKSESESPPPGGTRDSDSGRRAAHPALRLANSRLSNFKLRARACHSGSMEAAS